MKKNIWLLTTANLRKSKGQTASFFIIVLMASLLMNLGLVTWFNYDKTFDRRAEELNSPGVMMVLQNTNPSYISGLKDAIQKDGRTSRLEVKPILLMHGQCMYGNGEIPKNFAILNSSEQREIGKISYTAQSEAALENPIYLPHLFHTGGGYETGNKFTLIIDSADGGKQSFDYTVAGFFEETMLATINSLTVGLILDDDGYRSLSEHFAGSIDGSIFSVQLKDASENEAFLSGYLPTTEQSPLYDATYFELVKQARTITSTIGSMIIVAFSIIIVIISLIVVRFRIGNSIEEDMRNIGALKAIGYTGWQITLSILLQFISAGALGAASGAALSYALLPLVSDMFASQTGIIWRQSFDPAAAAITILSILAAIACVSLSSAGRARKLQPVQALRCGVLTHSFRRNPFPLDRGLGNSVIRLAGKTFFQNVRQNLLAVIIVSAITFAAVFAGVLFYNITLKTDNFLVSAVGELSPVRLDAASPQKADELLAQVQNMPQVRKAFFSHIASAVSREGSSVTCYTAPDYALYDNQNMVYRGRFPRYSNEIAIGGLLAKKLHLQPGDSIWLVQGKNEAEYLITGFVQGSNSLGQDAALTEDGYRRLSPDFLPLSITVYLNDGTDTGGFIQDVENRHGENIMAAIDTRKSIEGSLGIYQGIVGILTVVILAVTEAIIALTLFLIIKTSLLRKKREFGIQKAIGFTTGQLVMQSALSFLPILLIGTAAGCVTGYLTINKILSLLFSGIGMMKVNFEILPGMLALLSACIILSGFLISSLVSMRIRHITPYALMSEA